MNPTERLAEALDNVQMDRFGGPLKNCEHNRPTTRDCFRCDAAALIAQGFGHREDHIREFAAWADKNCDEGVDRMFIFIDGTVGMLVDRYLSQRTEGGEG